MKPDSAARRDGKPILIRVTHWIEDALLVGSLAVMIIVAFTQIVLRNLAHTGLYWADGLLRYLVLWVGLLGAMVATREDNHISVDVVSFLLPVRMKATVRVFTDAFTATVCLLLAWASIGFMRGEIGDNQIAFGFVPAWVGELIIPLCLAVIGARYLGYMIVHIRTALFAGKHSGDA